MAAAEVKHSNFVLSAFPYETVPVDLNRKPLKASGSGLQVDHGKAELPVWVGHIACLALAQREVFDAKQHPAVHGSPRVRTKAVGVALQNADTLFLHETLCRIAAVHRDLVPVADVEAAHPDEVVGEAAGQGVTGYVFDVQILEAKEFRHRQTGNAVEDPRVLDEVAPQAEFVISLDPGDAGLRQRAAETLLLSNILFRMAPEVECLLVVNVTRMGKAVKP